MNAPARVQRSPLSDWGTLGPLETPTLGRLLHILEAPCATLRHAAYDNGAQVGWHEHRAASLVYGVGGPCIERDSEGREFVKRRFSYHPRGYAHRLSYLAPTHVLAFELSDGIAARLPPDTRRLPATLYNQLWDLFVGLSRDGSEQWAQASLAALVADVVDFLAKPMPERLSAVLEGLHDNWNHPPPLSQTAAKFGVSPQLIRREFKRFFGVNLSEYRRLIRLDYARGLLWGSRARVAQVAAQTAFADQSHLCRVLKENTHLSPLELRRAAPCLTEAYQRWTIHQID